MPNDFSSGQSHYLRRPENYSQQYFLICSLWKQTRVINQSEVLKPKKICLQQITARVKTPRLIQLNWPNFILFQPLQGLNVSTALTNFVSNEIS